MSNGTLVTRPEGNTSCRTTKGSDFRNFLLVAQLDPEGIRARIREARLAAGLTQQELADLLEVHKRTVENYERFRVPDYRALNRIARVTNRDIEWFLHGENHDALDDGLREELAEAVRQLALVAPRLAAVADRLEGLLDDPQEAPASRKPRRSG